MQPNYDAGREVVGAMVTKLIHLLYLTMIVTTIRRTQGITILAGYFTGIRGTPSLRSGVLCVTSSNQFNSITFSCMQFYHHD